MTEAAKLAARYRRFAATEARDRSPLYAAISEAIAADDAALSLLLTLPEPKQQPNLLLAALRHLHGVQPDWPAFRDRLLADFPAIRAVMLTHATQTNEPARCATLLPLLARLPQPLALIEVGASAGLCLLPDLYGYDYGHHRIAPPSADAPVFRCHASTATPLPDAPPTIAWRAGLDLSPLDPADPDAAAWLRSLVWPEQTDRAARLDQALRVAARARPRVTPGDLRDDLARLAAQAPADATLVIFHTAVLAYLPDQADRDAFAAEAQRLAPAWIANEAPSVFPTIAARTGPAPAPGRFLLSLNSAPVAWTDPHGASLDWIATAET